MSEQTTDDGPTRTRLPGAWVGWLFTVAALVGVVGIVIGIVRADAIMAGKAIAMTMLFALSGARHRYQELPRPVEYAIVAAAGVYLLLTGVRWF